MGSDHTTGHKLMGVLVGAGDAAAAPQAAQGLLGFFVKSVVLSLPLSQAV